MEASARSVLLLLVLGSVCAGYISAAGVKFGCPSFDPATCLHSKPVQPECRNDKDCKGRMICCCSDCGFKCVPPVKPAKIGRCPPMAKNLRTRFPIHCLSDSACLGRKKCCKVFGYDCWIPLPEPAGVCPKNDGEVLSDLQCSSVKCTRNSDCEADKICCISGGEQKCVKPVVSG